MLTRVFPHAVAALPARARSWVQAYCNAMLEEIAEGGAKKVDGKRRLQFRKG